MQRGAANHALRARTPAVRTAPVPGRSGHPRPKHRFSQGLGNTPSQPSDARRSEGSVQMHPVQSPDPATCVDAPAGGSYVARDMIAGKIGASTAAPALPSFRVGDERLIKLTGDAAKKVTSLLTRQGRPQGVLRVAVVGGGCSGLQYKMDLQDQPQNRDILVESAGVRVVVDPKSALYVTGSELDYVDALTEGGFKVKNPNAATSCSCGESFSA